MKIMYLGRYGGKAKPAPAGDDDVLELLSNNWNDYGFETYFETSASVKGESVDLGAIRLLVENVDQTRAHLDRLLTEGWDGEFPIPDQAYISVPSEISFYSQIEAILGDESAVIAAKCLHDASYLVHIGEDETAQRLVSSDGFNKSLQRERGSVQSFLDGWRVFDQQAIAVLNLGFRFEDTFGKTSVLNLKFQGEDLFPHDINVLIGPNGSGKSRVLHQIVADWIDKPDSSELGFIAKPNLSQLVVVSYSPFELFPVDLKGRKLQDQGAYRYFGFRGRDNPTSTNRLGAIRLGTQFPNRNAANALLECLADDSRYRAITKWARKVATVEEVLKSAIDFDFAAVHVASDQSAGKYYSNTAFLDHLSFSVVENNESAQYIPIGSQRVSRLQHEPLKEDLIASSGVKFFKNNSPIELSSGQRLFAYIVINVLGAIRRNSLILVDEPELFLHPTLEVHFVEMLKGILTRFNSKALLATHSVVTVREIPADCVHVFDSTDDGLFLKHPPFQTFGGDFQRISSYVFGDRSVSKPFEQWIKSKLEEYSSAQALIEALGADANEELIVQIKAMEQGKW